MDGVCYPGNFLPGYNLHPIVNLSALGTSSGIYGLWAFFMFICSVLLMTEVFTKPGIIDTCSPFYPKNSHRCSVI